MCKALSHDIEIGPCGCWKRPAASATSRAAAADNAMTAPLYGLVLAGGRSTRMGRDKAALRL